VLLLSGFFQYLCQCVAEVHRTDFFPLGCPDFHFVAGGIVVPVYEDYNGQGTDYRLVGFWNVQTKQAIKVSEIKDEIIPENRICTLEQAEVYVRAVESFMEDMKTEEHTRENRPMYRTHDKEYVR